MAPVLSPQAKRIVGLALIATLIASVTIGGVVLGAAANTQEGDVNVRVVHASPDAPAVDVAVDNETVLTNVSYGNVSDYVSFAQGMHTVTITATNDSQSVLFEGQVNVEATGNYTLAVAGGMTKGAQSFEPVILRDDTSQPADDEAAIRLVHLAPNASTVDVTVAGSGEVLLENVSYKNVTEYATVPVGNHTLEIREDTASNDGDVITTVNVSVEGGTSYTAFAMATADSGNATAAAPLQIVIATDSVSEMGMAATGNETETANATETVTGTPLP